MSAKDDLTMYINVLGRVGLDDAIAEFAKVKSMTHRMDSNSLLQAQSKTNPNLSVSDAPNPQMGNSMPQGGIMPTNDQNTV